MLKELPDTWEKADEDARKLVFLSLVTDGLKIREATGFTGVCPSTVPVEDAESYLRPVKTILCAGRFTR